MWAQRLPLPVRDASRAQFLCETTDWLMSMAKCKNSTNFSFEAFFYHKKYFSKEISLDLWSRNPFYRFWFQLDLQLNHSGVQTHLRTWKPMGTSVKWAQSGSWRGRRLPQSPPWASETSSLETWWWSANALSGESGSAAKFWANPENPLPLTVTGWPW